MSGMSKSRISWCTHTWGVVEGCSPVSPGCDHCWARLMLHRYRRPETPTIHLDRMCAPLNRRKPALIFVCPMGDLFHERVDDSVIDVTFRAMERASQHRFLVLTKRPARMAAWLTRWLMDEAPLSNVALGVSVENQQTADERIPLLLPTPAAMRFVSMEPLLGPVLSRMAMSQIDCLDALSGVALPYLGADGDGRAMYGGECSFGPRLDWVIVGGESGAQARPMHPAWVRAIRDQCLEAHVPFYFKQWGEWAPIVSRHDDSPWPWGRGRYARWMETPHGAGWEYSKFRSDPWCMARVGVKKAGHLLQGKEYLEKPVWATI